MNKKATDLIKEFFEFVFNTDVSVSENENMNENVFDVSFKNPVAKKILVLNMSSVKTTLNLFLAFHLVDIGKFKINIIDNYDNN